MSATYAGGCQCGAVRYVFSVPVPAAYACHCGECKKQTASAFSMSIPFTYADLTVTGTPKVFETTAFSGKRKYNFFCGDCGTRLWHSGSYPPDAITLKVGTLDRSSDIAPVGHLWVSKNKPASLLTQRAINIRHSPKMWPLGAIIWGNNNGNDGLGFHII